MKRPEQAKHRRSHCASFPECVRINATFIHNSIAHLLIVSFASVLTNHRVLNLKHAINPHMQHETSTLPSLAFATNSFVGNLGAPFRVINEDEDEDELHDLGNNGHELQELDHEGEGASIVEDA